ncbi:MAG: ParB/RepB/Spo0J family partition protein [bacterium]
MSHIPLRLKPIKVEEIDLRCQPFLLNYPVQPPEADHSLAELIHSISQYGLISPITVQKTGDGQLFMVHGRKRFLACRSLGWLSMPSFIIPPSVEHQKVFLFSLSLFLTHKKPNIVEQARITRKLLSFFPEEVVIREYLPRLGLSPGRKVYARMNQLADLEDEIAQSLAANEVNPELAIRLGKISPPVRLQVYRFLRSLPLTVSEQFEALEYIQEIALREHVSLQSVLADPSISDILAQNTGPRQKAQTIRLILRKKRYPRLTSLEDEFLQGRKNLHLPEHVELYPPSGFEHGNYKFELRFADLSEFQQQLDLLNELSKKKKFQTLLRP